MKKSTFLLFDVCLFFIVLIDGQISSLLSLWLPLSVHMISHFIFVVSLGLSLRYSRLHFLIIASFLGFLYDVYYFNILGIVIFLFPVIFLVFVKYNHVFYRSIWTYISSLSISVFFFQITTFGIAQLIGLTALDLTTFIITSLIPTLVWNIACFLLFYPVFRKIFI